MLFLTYECAPWYRNIGKRFVKSSKGYMTDTLLLCHLLQYELRDLEVNRPELFGQILENFVATELLKLMTFRDDKMDLFHFRTSDNKEVDFVLEKPKGQLCAVDVKKSDNVSKADFKGLEECIALQVKISSAALFFFAAKMLFPSGQIYGLYQLVICGFNYFHGMVANEGKVGFKPWVKRGTLANFLVSTSQMLGLALSVGSINLSEISAIE